MSKHVVSKHVYSSIPKGKLFTLSNGVGYELFRGRWCDGYGFYFLREVSNTPQGSYVVVMTDTTIDLHETVRVEFVDTDPSDNVPFMKQMTKRYLDQEKATA